MHCRAASAAETDWEKICLLYDSLAHVAPGPVVELNRAVAISMARGPQAGLERVETLRDLLEQYPPYHATHAELLLRLGRTPEAIVAYRNYLEVEQTLPPAVTPSGAWKACSGRERPRRFANRTQVPRSQRLMAGVRCKRMAQSSGDSRRWPFCACPLLAGDLLPASLPNYVV